MRFEFCLIKTTILYFISLHHRMNAGVFRLIESYTRSAMQPLSYSITYQKSNTELPESKLCRIYLAKNGAFMAVQQYYAI